MSSTLKDQKQRDFPVLSSNDELVLNFVLNKAYDNQNDKSKEQKTIDTISSRAMASLSNESRALVQKYEAEGILLAEQNKLEDALLIFEKALNLCPQNSSILNNHAQTLRLLERNDLALEDLDKAIQYAAGDAQILKQAYTQRGAILKSLNRHDEALVDFKMGSKYGNEIARIASIKENPYSKLCGSVVQEIMQQYWCKSEKQ